MKTLGVWLRGERIGTLEAPRIGKLTFTYDAAALERRDLNVPVLSCSLPTRSGRRDAWAFASGLLPEGQHRDAMAGLAKVTTSDLLGMLARFGRDVAGAVVVGREDPEERAGGVAPYTDAALATAVGELPDHPLGLAEDSELSIAGVQDKMLLVELAGGGWGRPVHGEPSTHILKVDDRRFPHLVRAEHACLSIASAAGISAAESHLAQLGHRECIIVRRFDRTAVRGGAVERLHQEDACQALGIDPERNRRRAKYEKYGGPAFKDIARLLEAWGGDVEADLLRLLDRATFTTAIGDADAHGKNVGLLHPTEDSIALSPLYDTVPTVLWPSLRTQAAMSVNGRSDLGDIRLDDLVAEASGWGISPSVARTHASDLLERIIDVTDRGDLDVDSPAIASTGERSRRLLSR